MFFTESAEKRVFGLVLDPEIEPMIPSGSIFGVPPGPQKSVCNEFWDLRAAIGNNEFQSKFIGDVFGSQLAPFWGPGEALGGSGAPFLDDFG